VPESDLGFETASWPRRIGAYVVDAIASTLAVVSVMGVGDYSENDLSGLFVLGVFLAEAAIFTATLGGSFGKLATRLRVVPADGRPGPLAPQRVIARQLLVALLIPPLVFRSDGRGLHDLAAGSATVTLQTWRSLTGR
jgi:uncharacterized RDD family membrane protein YckC